MAGDPRKKALLEGLKDLVWKTYELEETIKNFGAESQPILDDRLLRFIDGVREIVPTTESVKGVRIPIDVLQHLDHGGNPHQYTAEVFRACTRDNQVSKGKVQAVEALRSALLTNMDSAYPDMTREYRAMVAAQEPQQKQPPPPPPE